MATYFQVKSFLNHWLDAVDEHSLHSPFFFDLFANVVRAETDPAQFVEIEKIRAKLLDNHHLLKIEDLGAPSAYFKNGTRTVAQVAATSLSSQRYCTLFYRMAKYMKVKSVVELGTSMGINALYLAQVRDARVVTFEGDSTIAGMALTNFESLDQTNIRLVEGNIDQTLPDYLQNPAKIDFSLIDANHRYEPTIRYFNALARRMSDRGVMVVDDIYRSEEMAQAWRELKAHDLVYGSVDLFHCGMLFFDLALNKQHFTWAY